MLDCNAKRLTICFVTLVHNDTQMEWLGSWLLPQVPAVEKAPQHTQYENKVHLRTKTLSLKEQDRGLS